MEIWNKYEKCRNYLDQTGLINRCNEQWDFYLDNQWNIGRNTSLSTGNPLPYFNIIKSIMDYHFHHTSLLNMSAMCFEFRLRQNPLHVCGLRLPACTTFYLWAILMCNSL